MSRLTDTMRAAPLGILLIAALFVMIGFGSVAGGAYIMFATGSLTLWAAVIALLVGPAVVYMAYHLVQREAWTWSALMLLLALLFLSSVLRLLLSSSLQISPLGEIAVEAAVAFYLTRPGIRASFGKDPRERL